MLAAATGSPGPAALVYLELYVDDNPELHDAYLAEHGGRRNLS